MSDNPDLWVVGDVQGYLEQLRGVLNGVALVDRAGRWTGGRAILAVAGDLVDRGPDGVGVIELLMRLQREAPRDGGHVEVVIGNHDILLLAAHLFGGWWQEEWRAVGGQATDMARLTAEHVHWLRRLPAMALEEDVLLMHADALSYLDYGSSLQQVNDRFRSILESDDLPEWGRLLNTFSEHRAFVGPDGCAHLERMLTTYGGRKLVHGHTPIARLLNQPAETITEAYVYCGGRCVNVDPGFYLGGAGFCYRA